GLLGRLGPFRSRQCDSGGLDGQVFHKLQVGGKPQLLVHPVCSVGFAGRSAGLPKGMPITSSPARRFPALRPAPPNPAGGTRTTSHSRRPIPSNVSVRPWRWSITRAIDWVIRIVPAIIPDRVGRSPSGFVSEAECSATIGVRETANHVGRSSGVTDS